MDMIKKELQSNNNSFELSCVKVEIDEIKSELVNVVFHHLMEIFSEFDC